MRVINRQHVDFVDWTILKHFVYNYQRLVIIDDDKKKYDHSRDGLNSVRTCKWVDSFELRMGWCLIQWFSLKEIESYIIYDGGGWYRAVLCTFFFSLISGLKYAFNSAPMIFTIVIDKWLLDLLHAKTMVTKKQNNNKTVHTAKSLRIELNEWVNEWVRVNEENQHWARFCSCKSA